MSWIKLIAKESNVPLSRIALGSAASGASKSVVLATIINSLNALNDPDQHFHYLVLFGIFVAAYKMIHSHVLERIAAEVEDIADRMRRRIIHKLQAAELRDIEAISRTEILNGLNTELPAVTRAVVTLFNAIQAGTLITFTFFFIGSLSQTAFMFIFFGSLMTASFQLTIFRQIRSETKALHAPEMNLNEVVEDALEGFRETKINEAKRNGVFRTVETLSKSLTERKKKVQRLISRQLVIGQVSYMLLVGAVVFIAPQVDASFNDVILKTSISMVFLMGPIGTFVGAFQILINVNASADNVMSLEAEIDELTQAASRSVNPQRWWQRMTAEAGEDTGRALTFGRTIEFRDVSFVHQTTPDLKPFRIGPLNFRIEQGQILLIVGGNGSGKSTLLKVLTGLYQPDAGQILMDGIPVTGQNLQQYREHFSVIFADHHMFARLYGLPTVDLEKLQELLDYLGLSHKTGYHNDRFDTMDLSTGQRKRLALIELLMEEKPIMIFDEWAAEQDPQSRNRFYSEILPNLRRQGRTIIAVTHDDAFFHLADVRLHMEQGLIKSIEMGVLAT